MPRPAHIAPLDEALEYHLERLDEAERHQARLHAEVADVIRELDEAMRARMEAYSAAKSCEDAIRRLGYVVLHGKGRAGVVGKDESRLDGHPGTFRTPITAEETP